MHISIKNSLLVNFLLISLLIGLCGCMEKSISIEEELLQKCIDAHGGMERWLSQDYITYDKNVVLYLENGEIEKELAQHHQYAYKPELAGTISWKDSVERKVVYKDNKAFKINGTKEEAPDPSSYNTFHAANYVLNMPWKLKDPIAKITYLGLDTLFNDSIVHTLKVEYPNAEKKDVWEYYLDQEEYHLVANKVHHGSTYSLITNDEYAMFEDLKYNSKRTSYMVDSLGNVLYLRAKYVYKY